MTASLLRSLRLCCFFFVFYWHINPRGLFNAKAILPEEQQWCHLTHSCEDKGDHTFPKCICPKASLNSSASGVRTRLQRFSFQLFNHYTKRTPPQDSFKYFSSFYSFFTTVPMSPATIGITVTFMFYSFLLNANVQVFVYIFTFFYFHFIVCKNGKSPKWQINFLLINTSSDFF